MKDLGYAIKGLVKWLAITFLIIYSITSLVSWPIIIGYIIDGDTIPNIYYLFIPGVFGWLWATIYYGYPELVKLGRGE